MIFATARRSISIHSLRVEGDRNGIILLRLWQIFQSTPSVWRETLAASKAVHLLPISIHSLRVEGDRQRQSQRRREWNFNPLPPCGGRPIKITGGNNGNQFQSTPSVWRETAKLHSFSLKTQQSKCNFDKKEHRYTSPCQKKYFFSDFFTKKRVRIPHAFSVRLGFAPERFLRTKAVPPHRWFPLHRYVPLSSDTDFPDSRTGGCPSRHQWHPSAAV